MKRSIALLVAALLAFGAFSGVFAGSYEPADTPTQGYCGPSIAWEYSNGRLTLTGSGNMTENTSYSNTWAPWYALREQITSVTMSADITSISAYAFNELSHITSVTIPSHAESIGIGAFNWCSSLRNIYVGTGSSHFVSVDGVVFSSDLRTLAFFPTGRSGEYTVPEGTEKIGNHAFFSCIINKVTVPEGVTAIESAGFMSCMEMTEVLLPESLVSIADKAFYNCCELTSVVLGENVAVLDTLCFAYCRQLTVAEAYGPAPTSYGYSMFLETGEGFRIRYPYELRSSWDTNYNGYWTVSNHERYRLEPRYPAGGTAGDNITWTWDQDALTLTVTGTGAMPDFTNDGGAPWSCINEMAQTVVIGEGITDIGDYAFTSFYALTDLTIPSTVKRIGVQAFENCSALQTVTLPAGITSVDYGAFQYCYNLTSAVFLGEPPAVFGEDVFYECGDGFCIGYFSAYASAWAPNGEIFWNGYFIRPVDAEVNYGICGPSLAWQFDEETGVLTITGTGWMYSFYDLEEAQPWDEYKDNITSVVIEEGAESIGRNAFAQYPAIETVYIPTTVSSIEDYCFTACPQLQSIFVAEGSEYYYDIDGVLCGFNVGGGDIPISKDGDDDEPVTVYLIRYPAGRSGAYTVPAEVTNIGSGAFIMCSGLTGIALHNGITEIGSEAFIYCTALTSVTIPGNDMSINGYAFAGSGLISLVFEEGSHWTGDYSFAECASLTSITFPSTFVYIGYRAFENCTALEEIILPESLADIEYYAFGGCTSLSRAVFMGPVPEYYSIPIFDDCAEDFCIYYAEEYASSWAPEGETEWEEYPIAPLSEMPPAIAPGDLDGDGVISMSDVTMLSMFLNGENPQISSSGLQAADANGDGTVDIRDIAAIYQKIAQS